MNIELVRDMIAQAGRKYKEHNEAYGVTGRYYNLKAMEKYQDLIDIYSEALRADSIRVTVQENDSIRFRRFVNEIYKLLQERGMMTDRDFKEFMNTTGWKLLSGREMD